MTFSETAHRYVVHELLSLNDDKTPCNPPEVMHPSENAGKDFVADSDGFWKGIVHTKRRRWTSPIVVDAGPIEHRGKRLQHFIFYSQKWLLLVPSIGYVFRESTFPSRKLVFLGDTSDASSIIPLCISPPPSLVVHEATDTYIPKTLDPHGRKTEEQILAKVLEKGHSTPGMAGEFAKKVEAKMLLLNHISAK
jgi:ribonuclease Z